MPRDSSTYGHSSPRRRRRAVVNDKAHSSSSRTYSEKLNSVLASTGGSIVRSEKAHSSSSRTFSEVVDSLLESTGGSILRSEKPYASTPTSVLVSCLGRGFSFTRLTIYNWFNYQFGYPQGFTQTYGVFAFGIPSLQLHLKPFSIHRRHL